MARNLNSMCAGMGVYPTAAAAEAVAQKLASDPTDDWTYTVQPGKGGFVVAICDEDGNFVAYWS